MSRKQARLAIPAAVVLVSAGWWWVGAARAQTATEQRRWEYATLEAAGEYWRGNVKYSTANVCYHAANGCRWETVRVSVRQWGQMNDAVAAAAARLGESGWEIVTATPQSEISWATVLLKRPLSGQN